MINVQVDEEQLLDLLMQRVEYWDKEDLKNNGIDVDDSTKVLARDVDNDLYLVSAH